MKTSKDPRHILRRKIIKNLFSESFYKKQKFLSETEKIIKDLKKIDKIISQAAPQWPLEKLNKIDLAILRLAVFEMLEGKIPTKVVIDEAIELSKEYGSENTPSFVNGVLGTIYKKENENK
jgi:transcription antitermination protein NusB